MPVQIKGEPPAEGSLASFGAQTTYPFPSSTNVPNFPLINQSVRPNMPPLYPQQFPLPPSGYGVMPTQTVTQPQTSVAQTVAPSKEKEKSPPPAFNENQVDSASYKGIFGWATVDNINVPYIFRKDKKFVSVRVVEMKLLSRYPNSFPDELGKREPLTSYYVTEIEAKLLNEINTEHCGLEFGNKQFTTQDLIVDLEEFEEFYRLVKKTFPDDVLKSMKSPVNSEEDRSSVTSNKKDGNEAVTPVTAAKTPPQGKASFNPEVKQHCGWLQVNNTVSPYIRRNNCRFLPISVIKHAAGLLKDVSIETATPTQLECDFLNAACSLAGFDFKFGSNTKLIPLLEVTSRYAVHITDLPFECPIQSAKYLDLPSSTSVGGSEPNINYPPNIDVSRTLPNHVMPNSSSQTSQRYPHYPHSNMGQLPQMSQGPMSMRMPAMSNVRSSQNNPFIPPYAMFQQRGHNFPQRSMNPRMMGQGMRPPNMIVSQGNRVPSPSSSRPSQQQSSYKNSAPPMQTYPSQQQQQQQQTNGMRIPMGSKGQGQPVMPPMHASRLFPPSTVPGQLPLPLNQNKNKQPQNMANLSQQQQQQQQRQEMIQQQQQQQQMMQQQYLAQQLSQQQKQQQQQQRFSQPNSVSGIGQRTSPGASLPAMPPLSGPRGQINPQQRPSVTPPNQQQMHNSQQSFQTTTSPQPLPNSVSPVNKDNSQPNTVNTSVPMSNSNPLLGDILNQMPVITSVRGNVQEHNSENEAHKSTSISAKPMNSNDQTDNVNKFPPDVSPLVSSIFGVCLHGKSISCMELKGPNRQGKYCLVEAVCKLYFSQCSINEFLYGIENALKIPLIACTDEEEKAFIQYYSLPVTVLKCNKMISYKDLGEFYPQMSYMFPQNSEQSSGKSQVSDINTSNSDQTSSQNTSNILVTNNENQNSNEFVAIPLMTVGDDQENNSASQGQSTGVKRPADSVSASSSAKYPCRRLEDMVKKLHQSQQDPTTNTSQQASSSSQSVIIID